MHKHNIYKLLVASGQNCSDVI